MKNLLFAIICLWGLLSCSSNNVNSDLEREMAATEAFETRLDDTLRLIEGTIPKDWVKLELKDGYYIAFPKKPSEKEVKKNNRIDYKLKRSNYRLGITLTDLSEEASFQENKKNRTAYYQAILEDLAESVDANVEQQELFYSQGIYEGVKAIVSSEDARVYIQAVIIDNTLYTASLALFKEEDKGYLQLKDKFFYSFGNDLYKTKNERDTVNLSM